MKVGLIKFIFEETQKITMSGAIKMENGSVLKGKTFLKETGTIKYSWNVANLQEFKQLNRTLYSPDFNVTEDNGLVETFKMELDISQHNMQTVKYTLFLTKDGGSNTVRAAIDGRDGSSERKTFEISGLDQQEIGGKTCAK